MQQLLPPAPAEGKRVCVAPASAAEAPPATAAGGASTDLLAEAAVEMLPAAAPQCAAPAAALAGSDAGFGAQEGRRGADATQVIHAPQLAHVVAGTAKPPMPVVSGTPLAATAAL